MLFSRNMLIGMLSLDFMSLNADEMLLNDEGFLFIAYFVASLNIPTPHGIS